MVAKVEQAGGKDLEGPETGRFEAEPENHWSEKYYFSFARRGLTGIQHKQCDLFQNFIFQNKIWAVHRRGRMGSLSVGTTL